jgi:solute:Na+ symporter, SSS family
MSDRLIWLFVFFALYAAYCTFWGAASAQGRRSADEFFLGERQIPAWIFVVAATVTSFTGWIAIGLPAMIFKDGFPAASLALCAIAIPLAGSLFVKRQWVLSRRFGYVTSAEMLSDYFGGRLMRLIVLLIALLFALPFLGMQMSATGYLIQILSDGAIPWVFAMWLLAGLVFLYVCLGGIRAAAYVGVLQGLLFAAAIVAFGAVAWAEIGGFASFVDLLAKLGASKFGAWGASSAGYNAYFETPGVVQFVAGLGREAPAGGVWTASMTLSYSFSLMGLQLAPAFTIGAFAARDARGFAPQQVWGAGAAIGFALVFFGVIGGMGALFLGGSAAIEAGGLGVAHAMPGLDGGRQAGLLAYAVKSVGERAPWLMALLAVAATAATQASASLYSSATGTMFARDFYKHFLNPSASDRQLKLSGRIGIGLTLLGALLGATFAPHAQVQFGALALAFGFQLLPAMAALCWLPWLTPRAVVSGLVAGLVVVVFTDKLGVALAHFIGVDLPWGRWPWTIHSAGWGIACNLAVCLIFSLLTQRASGRERRMKFHDFLALACASSTDMRLLRPAAWAIALVWFFFALGPGLVFGTDVFGAPNAGVAAWMFGIPSIWAWQLIFWATGVLLLWFLAYRLELSTPPHVKIEPEVDRLGPLL